MELHTQAGIGAFGAEVELFLTKHWRESYAGDIAAEREFRSRAVAAGLIYRNVPARYGGSEQPADPMRDYTIASLFARVRAPRAVRGVGTALLVPALLKHGAEWQRERFIPPALTGEELWAQGYSEPEAGSDLASLRTRAELINDLWHITGQKIWSSGADHARFMFALVRTEPAKRKAGISCLLVDLQNDGVCVTPIRQLNGDASFCEVAFDGATTPSDWMIGERGAGWEVAQSILRVERTFVGSATESRAVFDDLIQLGRDLEKRGRFPLRDPVIRRRLVEVEGRIEAHLCAQQHQVSLLSQGNEVRDLAGLNKLNSTSFLHELWAIAAEMLGEEAAAAPQRDNGVGSRTPAQWVEIGMRAMSRSIAGGTSNIQRDIIAKRILGLPQI